MNEKQFSMSLVRDMLSGWALKTSVDRSALSFLARFVGKDGVGLQEVFDIAYNLGKEHRGQCVLPDDLMRISRYQEALEVLPDPVKFNTPLGRPLLQLERHAFVLSYLVGYEGYLEELREISTRESRYLRLFCLKGYLSKFLYMAEEEVLRTFVAWIRTVRAWLKDPQRSYEHEETIAMIR